MRQKRVMSSTPICRKQQCSSCLTLLLIEYFAILFLIFIVDYDCSIHLVGTSLDVAPRLTCWKEYIVLYSIIENHKKMQFFEAAKEVNAYSYFTMNCLFIFYDE